MEGVLSEGVLSEGIFSEVLSAHPPLPLPFVSYVYYPPLLCHPPFHYISEVSTATSTNQHNHHNIVIDVG